MTQTVTSSSPATTPTSTMILKQQQQHQPQPQQPSKSILKPSTSTIGAKRKKSDMDIPSDISATLPSDSSTEGSGSSQPRKKRVRVQFDMDDGRGSTTQSGTPNTGTPASSTNGGEKSTALVREEVRRAIQRRLAGDGDAYDRIRDIFSADPNAVEDDGVTYRHHDPPTHQSLRNHMLGLLANVSALDGSCNGLVYAVLSSQWLGRDEEYARLFAKFLGTLAAARGAYLNSVLKMLVGYLREVPRGVRALPGYAVVSTSEVYRRVHVAIKYIVNLIPSGSVALAPQLSSSFPQDTDKTKSHIAYTRNLIKIIDYAPELKADILALITEKLVKIDVQIQVDMEDFEEEIGEEILQTMSTAESVALEDEDDSDEDDESATSEDGDLDAESQRVKVTKENFQKVDYMMDMLFEYYAIPFMSGSLDDQENTLELLLAHFRNIILPTYRSRHSQFLLFHFAQASPILIDRFATACIQITFSKSQPTLIRQYAAAYLASFVARGAHVSSEVVRDVFDLLGSQLRSLMSEYEPSCRGPDLRRYGTFYATAQALLYIFCFRWRDLTTITLDEDNNNGPPPDLELDEVSFSPGITDLMRDAIASPLNPLKICSPDIVNEFARLSHHLSFLYVHSKLETNKRVRVQPFRGTATSGALNAQFGQIERETRADDDRGLGVQLDAYFPFDPYRPRRSGRWLDGDYVHYRGIPGLHGRDDDEQHDSDSHAGDDGQHVDSETETDGE